jgi:hypothetical protein
MHDERVEVVGQASGRRRVAGLVELAHQGDESLLAVVFVGGLIECLPVGLAHMFACALGQLVAHAVRGAVLAV